ncbi:two-component system sensor histidine kinase YesM [Bacillus niacini]|uniref:Two-component system sensor histidine kinase YesM n=1 Tax=Neobacillus niacini TaxID=86668 RepID=A0A852TGZ0_9BACI|nr:histidine kinase [Neobacillus niacini]NYE08063.1 two-component system sensor histidine kinase YesM [Neobacillus niacini]
MRWGIRKKLIIFLLLVTVLPFGTAITVTYFYTTKSLNEQSVSTNYDLIVKGKEELTVYLNDVAQMSSVPYRYTPFMNVMRNGVSSNLAVNQEEVRRVLAYLFNTRPEIEQMHLYIHEGKESYTNYHSRISGRATYENIFSHLYYGPLTAIEGYSLIEPPHEIYSYNNISVIPNSQKVNVLSFHNVIRDVPLADVLGFLSIDINLSRISAIADRLYTKDVEDLYIMNEKGMIIYSSNGNEIGKENKQKWFEQVKREPEGGKSFEWKDEQFSGVIVHEKFTDSFKDWSIVKRTPYDVLYKGARETAIINILIGLATLVFALLGTMFVSFKLTAPIKLLIGNMKKVEKGEFKADFESLGTDEIGMLGRHFKLMIAKIEELIEREYKLEIENKASQLRVLQSQINPHFLYNAFQSIGTLALKLNAVPVYSLLTSLSTIMRYSMNMKEDIVPFAAELNHVKSYLSLQKQRFDEQFEFELYVEEAVKEVHVPKMILQPIVENCFKHGFDQRIEKAWIQIEAFHENDNRVQINVKDNGMGPSEEQLEKIRQELFHGISKEDKQREAIGLKNIYDRLQIYYHNQANLSVNRNEEGGFTVTILIPTVIPKEVEHS